MDHGPSNITHTYYRASSSSNGRPAFGTFTAVPPDASAIDNQLSIDFKLFEGLGGQVTFVHGQVKRKCTCPKDKCLKKLMSSPAIQCPEHGSRCDVTWGSHVPLT